jgi:prephenate dehydrogenase
VFAPSFRHSPTLGIIGLGAFGQLVARHLAPHLTVLASDPQLAQPAPAGVTMADLAQVCGCDMVVLAVPLSALDTVCRQIAPMLRPGAVVLDVCSTKMRAADIMRQTLPATVALIGTHPMFGPQSIRAGTAGLNMVICPLRGRAHHRVAAFLRRVFGLSIIMATPEEHDREAGYTQGLTHLIARALMGMAPMPGRMTTRSFDLLREAVEMVSHDAPGVTAAIEANPHARAARLAFLAQLEHLCREMPGMAPPSRVAG